MVSDNRVTGRPQRMVMRCHDAAIPTTTLTGTAAQLTERLVAFADQGVTEIVYQPTGPDITRELEAFITAARAVLVG